MIKPASAYVLTKATLVGGATAAVIGNGDIPVLLRSLIVAIVSGVLGIIGIVLGARLSNRGNRDIIELAQKNHELAEENRTLSQEVKNLQTQTLDKLNE